MQTLQNFCNCTFITTPISRAYDKIIKRKKIIPSPDNIFNNKGLVTARPSLVLPYGGKFESLDYELIENDVTIIIQQEKGFLHLTCQFFIRCFLLVLSGITVGLIGAVLSYSMTKILCYKNSFLRKKLFEHADVSSIKIYLWGSLINGAIAFLGSFAVVFIEPAASGGGVFGIMGFINGVNVPKVVKFKTLLVKIFSVLCMRCAGLPGGKEGPLIHIGGIVASSLPFATVPFTNIRLFPFVFTDSDRVDFAACGVAAGLAAAFATPIGAMLMSLEEYVTFWSWDLVFKIFVCSLFSSSSFVLFRSIFEGHANLLEPENFSFLHPFPYGAILDYGFFMIPMLILIGIFGAILGTIWIFIHKLMTLFRKKFLKFKVMQVTEVVFWAVVMNSLATTYLLGLKYCSKIPKIKHLDTCFPTGVDTYDWTNGCPSGYFNTMSIYGFQEQEKVFEFLLFVDPEFIGLQPIAIIFASYFLMSAFFGGSKITAGLFVPNMVNGSAMGRTIALITWRIAGEKNLWWANPMIYAFYGSVAFLCGVVRLTFSLSVVYIEGCSAVMLLFPVFITIITVKIISDCIIEGVYEVQYNMEAVPVLKQTPPPVATGLLAMDVMSRNGVTFLTQQTSIKKIIQVAFETRHNGFPVVDTKHSTARGRDDFDSVGRVYGLILRSKLLILLRNQWFDPEMAQNLDRVKIFRRDFALNLSPPKQEATSLENRSVMNMEANVVLDNYMDSSPLVIDSKATLNRTYRLFVKMGLRHLIVVNNANEAIGMITRKDLAAFKTKYYVIGVKLFKEKYS